MTSLPSVVRAEYRGAFRIHLTFSDKSEATVDFQRWLDGPVFEPLKDPIYFRRFFIDGGTVVWPNGADIAHTGIRLLRSSVSQSSRVAWSGAAF